MKVPVSVVIISKNEEEHIANCIKSVQNWADEIIVVDDESTDRTVEIAKSLGAKVFTRKMDIEGKHRNWAYQQATNRWVLSLDADEIVTEELKQEVTKAIQKQATFTQFTVNIRNYHLYLRELQIKHIFFNTYTQLIINYNFKENYVGQVYTNYLKSNQPCFQAFLYQ